MAADESLSSYDHITSKELFESFMDVVTSAERSINEEQTNKSLSYDHSNETDVKDGLSNTQILLDSNKSYQSNVFGKTIENSGNSLEKYSCLVSNLDELDTVNDTPSASLIAEKTDYIINDVTDKTEVCNNNIGINKLNVNGDVVNKPLDTQINNQIVHNSSSDANSYLNKSRSSNLVGCDSNTVSSYSSTDNHVHQTCRDDTATFVDNEINSDIKTCSNSTTEMVFNAEQIAFGCKKSNTTTPNEFYQTCIQTIEEKTESMSPQTPDLTHKDKRFLFGFAKRKSTDNASKTSTSCGHRTTPSNCFNIDIPVICSGYLFKQGGTGFIPKNWKLRWFQLKKDNCLYYSKSEQDQIPIGAVILMKYQVSRVLNLNKRFAFKISKGGARTYFFASNSEEEMRKWMGFLGIAVKESVSNLTSIPECSLKNVSIPATSIDDPDCHGFLTKQGNIHKTWRKRYCVLKYGCLFYYEDMTDKVAIGVFKLHRYSVHKTGNIKNGFEAVPPLRKMRTYYFYTNTETDTQRWIDAMRWSLSSLQ